MAIGNLNINIIIILLAYITLYFKFKWYFYVKIVIYNKNAVKETKGMSVEISGVKGYEYQYLVTLYLSLKYLEQENISTLI